MEEFLKVLRYYREVEVAEYKSAFRTFDITNSGFIEAHDMTQLLMMLHRMPSINLIHSTLQDVQTSE